MLSVIADSQNDIYHVVVKVIEVNGQLENCRDYVFILVLRSFVC